MKRPGKWTCQQSRVHSPNVSVEGRVPWSLIQRAKYFRRLHWGKGRPFLVCLSSLSSIIESIESGAILLSVILNLLSNPRVNCCPPNSQNSSPGQSQVIPVSSRPKFFLVKRPVPCYDAPQTMENRRSRPGRDSR